MFIRKTKKKDRLYQSIAKGIWDPEKKNARSVTVRSLGYADRLEEEHGDAMAYARRVLQECEAAEQKDAEEKTVTLTISLDREIPTLDDGSGYTVYLDEVRNLGYGILKEIYLRLELDRFWNGKARAYPVSFSVDRLFRLLVFGWALYPGSVAEILHRCRRFFEPTDAFSLDHVSQLDAIVSAQKEELQAWILKHAADVLHGELSPEQRSSLQNPLAASSLDDTAGEYAFREQDPFGEEKSSFGPTIQCCWLDQSRAFSAAVQHVSACLVLLLQMILPRAYPAEAILASLRQYTCVPFAENYYQMPYFDGILDDCGTALDLPLDYKYRTRQQLQRMLRY